MKRGYRGRRRVEEGRLKRSIFLSLRLPVFLSRWLRDGRRKRIHQNGSQSLRNPRSSFILLLICFFLSYLVQFENGSPLLMPPYWILFDPVGDNDGDGGDGFAALLYTTTTTTFSTSTSTATTTTNTTTTTTNTTSSSSKPNPNGREGHKNHDRPCHDTRCILFRHDADCHMCH